MAIILTGANGQVGSEIKLLASEYDMPVNAYSHLQCDILNYDILKNLIEAELPEAVVNTAAYTAVDKAEDDADSAYAINHKGSENLARICADLNIPLIQLSTDYVFDGKADKPYLETDATLPESIYGKSKLDGENAIIKQCKKYIILRTSWVFGRYGNNFVKTMLRLASERKELSVVKDQTGCPTSARSIAQAVLKIVSAIRQGDTNWGIYHFCGKPETTWYNFAREIFHQAEAFGQKPPAIVPITSTEYPQRASRPMYSVLNCEKIQSVYAIKQPDWNEDLHNLLEDLIY